MQIRACATIMHTIHLTLIDKVVWVTACGKVISAAAHDLSADNLL